MKRFIITICCAALFMASSSAQTSKTTEKYIIDGREITNFDGSQLKDKVILDYKIEPGTECFVHRITTADSLKNLKVKLDGWKIDIPKIFDEGANKGKYKLVIKKDKLLYIVDGVEKKNGLEGIDLTNIASVTVFKPGSKEALSYGEAGKNGVVIIKTRKEDHIVYTINGKKATKIEVDKLTPNLIKNVIVMKRGSKAAVKLAGKKGGNQNDYI
ncbi:MAG: energy transducer TonB, partial [Segatella salivae]